MNVSEWLENWFEKNTVATVEDIRKSKEQNYMLNGLVDSMGLIGFVCEIENVFNISFSNDEFQNRGFSTIDGLEEIIKKKIEQKDE